MIMSQVIYSALRADNPDVHIDVLAPRATLSLVQRMREVDRGILIDQKHGEFGFSYRRRLGAKLAENHYDLAIVTPNSLKSALVPFFAHIPRRVGFLAEFRYFLLNDLRLLDKKRLPRMTDRFLELVDKSGDDMIRPELLVDDVNQRLFLEENHIDTSTPVVGFCPGAEFGDAKKWPETHYAALGRKLAAAGKQVWLFGSPADASTGEAIAQAIGPGCVNLAGKTSLLDAIDLLALCDSVVSNDSGLMHVAAAVGTPVTAIYGSTSPGFTPPLSDQAQTVRLGLDCSPCFKRECPLGHKNCLNQLTPDQVESAL
ncbi:MAG: lipopolysaccharide heptosyltransferase II [Pseudomonadales bacterium]|nr:lipopolysaccharide heptosyltransferase II [Pseudomonadales bacterium]MBO6563729.1 lipopolysaccharide heptosyltransferase II [Pseudomonadales bacterium]MBO6597357.1 lipopolysaccharide heptosyltransferase II [Pseudomonadales bacterium]MBO6658742.1 lipopolysaccharide heptosyltransferase II [Pseudomonadales bacterium]MBO6824091.1 lipopolysaccharide heptosyltransferase II [Pseudomonadales bacterium]